MEYFYNKNNVSNTDEDIIFMLGNIARLIENKATLHRNPVGMLTYLYKTNAIKNIGKLIEDMDNIDSSGLVTRYKLICLIAFGDYPDTNDSTVACLAHLVLSNDKTLPVEQRIAKVASINSTEKHITQWLTNDRVYYWLNKSSLHDVEMYNTVVKGTEFESEAYNG